MVFAYYLCTSSLSFKSPLDKLQYLIQCLPITSFYGFNVVLGRRQVQVLLLGTVWIFFLQMFSICGWLNPQMWKPQIRRTDWTSLFPDAPLTETLPPHSVLRGFSHVLPHLPAVLGLCSAPGSPGKKLPREVRALGRAALPSQGWVSSHRPQGELLMFHSDLAHYVSILPNSVPPYYKFCHIVFWCFI